MKLHTRLTATELTACLPAGGAVGFIRLNPAGSRSHAHAFDVILSGSSKYGGGQYGDMDGKSATWDEWGMFLANVFTADPAAKCTYYTSAEHFTWATGGRYSGPFVAHRQHSWRGEGVSATGTYQVQRCEGCRAIRRYMSPGYRFADISAVS